MVHLIHHHHQDQMVEQVVEVLAELEEQEHLEPMLLVEAVVVQKELLLDQEATVVQE